jgi:hypothetical protein
MIADVYGEDGLNGYHSHTPQTAQRIQLPIGRMSNKHKSGITA